MIAVAVRGIYLHEEGQVLRQAQLKQKAWLPVGPRVTDTHSLLRSCCRESSRQKYRNNTKWPETRCGGEVQLLPPELAIIAPIGPDVAAEFAWYFRQLDAAPLASNKDGGS